MLFSSHCPPPTRVNLCQKALHDANVRGFLLLVGYTINWASVVLLLWVDSGGELKWVVWGGLPEPPIRLPESPSACY